MGKYISSDAWPENEKAPTPPSIDSPMPLNEGTNFTSSDCGKVNGLATGPALKPGEGMLAINGSTDLSSCVVGNYDGKVFQIYSSLIPGGYGYEILVLAQGPAGTGSGSIWLTFGDESGDHYRLRIFSSTKKWHYVRYNSDKPGITSLNWNDSKP